MFRFLIPSAFDVLDVLIVSFILYKSYFTFRGTRASRMLTGLILILLLYFVGIFLNLRLLNSLISTARTAWIVIFVIIFQPELRQLLASSASNRLFGFFTKSRTPTEIESIIAAVEIMAQKHVGALIVLERDGSLSQLYKSGEMLDAPISAKLIQSIFAPNTPLHDGAVIIQNNRIVAAACTLPLTVQEKYLQSHGTRHQAAVGLSESTDAIVIVVSEETGYISLAHEGDLMRNLSGIELSYWLKASIQ